MPTFVTLIGRVQFYYSENFVSVAVIDSGSFKGDKEIDALERSVIGSIKKLYHKMLHNETAFAIQRNLQWDGITTVILLIRMKI